MIYGLPIVLLESRSNIPTMLFPIFSVISLMISMCMFDCYLKNENFITLEEFKNMYYELRTAKSA